MKKKIKLPTNRNFGLVFFTVFLIISLWPLLNQNEIRQTYLILSIVFLILGLFNSRILLPLNKFWMKFGLFLGNLISPIVMSIVFFCVVTPIGIIVRLLRKDILNLKKNKSNSYWIKKDNSYNNMKNQF